METFKSTVRFTVLSFVLVAGVISMMGLSPAGKVEAESLATDEPATTEISTTDNSKVLAAHLSTTG